MAVTHRSVITTLAALALAGVALPAQADQMSFGFTTIDVPGAVRTEATGINDAGQIVGWYSSNNTVQHGFLTTTGNTFTTIDAPGATTTRLSGINSNGQILGAASTTPPGSAFLDTAGSFATIFIAPQGHANGINASNQIVGQYLTGQFQQPGFVITAGSSDFKTITAGNAATSVTGINDAGQMVGLFFDSSGEHGFLIPNTPIFTLLRVDVPGAINTEALGINNNGQIVGDFQDNTGLHGFLDIKGVYTPFDVPGGLNTQALGINDAGQIVGIFTDPHIRIHGFIATPVSASSAAGPVSAIPEPSAVIMIATALLGLGLARRRRAT